MPTNPSIPAEVIELPDVTALARRLLAEGVPNVYATILAAVQRAVFVVTNERLGSEVEAARVLGISRTSLRTRKQRVGVPRVDGRAGNGRGRFDEPKPPAPNPEPRCRACLGLRRAPAPDGPHLRPCPECYGRGTLPSSPAPEDVPCSNS